jgi:predicted type IV restriction endonuclease
LEAIERVRERIERHGSKLSQNEMLTRYALVDPILRALGWDTEDPEQVVPEFQTEVGRPDYILHCADLRIGVEAKRLGADEKTFEQAYLRALPLWQSREIRYYAITDGDRWILWDISKPRTQNPEPIVDIRLSRDNLGDAARQLLALWRPAMPKVKVGAPLVATGERESEERRKPETRVETQRQR